MEMSLEIRVYEDLKILVIFLLLMYQNFIIYKYYPSIKCLDSILYLFYIFERLLLLNILYILITQELFVIRTLIKLYQRIQNNHQLIHLE
jgi:hypothetical protein